MDDDLIRMAAFSWLKEQFDLHGEILDWSDLANGFIYKDHRIRIAGQSGIWKPQAMQYPISITTKFGGPYPDRLNKDGLIEYRYRGENPNFWDNVGLRETMKLKKPLIYLWNIPGSLFCLIPGLYCP